MKFSEQWLREWVDPELTTDALAEQLTMAGLEVDAITPAAPEFTNTVVASVLSVEKHPDADRLSLCAVDDGSNEPLNVVCGAPNVRAGMRVPFARVGAELPNGMKIKRTKVRGSESFGMLCSGRELGLVDSADGLMTLPDDAPPGQDLREYLNLNDCSIELSVTPNRGDCLSVAGIAREVAALNRLPLHTPEIPAVPAVIDDVLPVDIKADKACPHYVGRVIRGVNARAETPLWMQERLRRSGLRSLGPLVDVTNYVLLELGQPMHAFDLDRLAQGLCIRLAQPGERLSLLDGCEVELKADMLVIADGNGPVALAGIMGGEATAVSDGSINIFLESAFFAPEAIAGRARQYGLQTDSSQRFERGVDPEGQTLAIERATQLLVGITGGEPGPLIDTGVGRPAPSGITLRQSRVTQLLGLTIEDEAISEILGRLGMTIESQVEHTWQVTPPGFRFDIAIEADLIEELARSVGYDQLPSQLPVIGQRMHPRPEGVVALGSIRAALVFRGYHEAITYSFVDPDLMAHIDPNHAGVKLANPLSPELSVMRSTLWPGLLNALRFNQRRQIERIRLFETGLNFIQQGTDLQQENYIGGVVSGTVEPEQWGASARAVDYFDVKADVESLLALTGNAKAYIFKENQHPALHSGQTACIEFRGEPVGWVGMLHPAVRDALKIETPVGLFELRLDALQTRTIPTYTAVSKFPSIRRDIAVVINDDVAVEQLRTTVEKVAGSALMGVKIFDVYQGVEVEKGLKSVALALILQETSRTLIDQEVEEIVRRVIDALADDHGAILRE
ncbi:MAG: phenylalanine--tRNA ligase subunit beta [Gammaproteobacteria bacterium]|nr:MAG: phenylalanine--tRNA ligase subunit beta [Gammaproteobacteria bacterium]